MSFEVDPHLPLLTFGLQLDRLVGLHHTLLKKPVEASTVNPDLKGKESFLAGVVGNLVIERMHILGDYGLGSEAVQIACDRMAIMQMRDSEGLAFKTSSILEHMAHYGDY